MLLLVFLLMGCTTMPMSDYYTYQRIRTYKYCLKTDYKVNFAGYETKEFPEIIDVWEYRCLPSHIQNKYEKKQ